MKLFFCSMSKIRRMVSFHLKKYISSYDQNTFLLKAIKYSVFAGGKRLRAFLVYQVGKMLGCSIKSLHVPAMAIECIHSYSLIHDDLPMMDNGKTRRGKPTCHIKFGEETAILAGNALHSLAFNILSNGEMPNISIKDRLRMIICLSDAIGVNGLCLGQWLDLQAEFLNKEVSEREIEIIHKKKTGSLIYAAVKMASLFYKRNEKIIEYLYRYAICISLVFQITDDILDIYEDIRKNNGSNLRILKKNNYSILFGLKQSKKKVQNLYMQSISYLKNIEKLGYNISMLEKFTNYIKKRNK